MLSAGLAAAADQEYRVAHAAAAGGALLAADEPAWAAASAITWGPVAHPTTFRAVWSEAGLFLRFDARDESPWHTLTKRDEHLWDEEVVEIFLDLDGSGRDYYELEVNPANVTCDLRMISPWPDKKGDITFDLDGLATQVHLTDGTWTATALLPWAGLRSLPSAASIVLPPKPGDAWRFNVFRIERPGGPEAPERDAVFAAWSPPPGESFHVPAAFRSFVFEEPAASR
jgi:hypothetical protein